MNDRAWLGDLRPVPGADGYLVSASGDVFSTRIQGARTGRRGSLHPLKPAIGHGGYPRVVVSINGRHRSMRVHQLVALAFLGPRPQGADVRHLDGNPLNNRPTNLAYGTRRDNMADREAHGRTARGERVGQAKLTDEAVREIRNLLANGAGVRAIARRFGVAHPQIINIRDGKTWTHVRTT